MKKTNIQHGVLGKQAALFKEKQASSTKQKGESEVEFNIQDFRCSIEEAFSDWLSAVVLPEDIFFSEKMLTVSSGRQVKLHFYKPKDNVHDHLPVVIFHPGGGLALDMAHHHKHICAEIAKESEAIVVCVQPELSPENKFPEILVDAYEATKLACDLAVSELGANPGVVALSGYSAGGALAMQIALQAINDDSLNITAIAITSGVFNLGDAPKSAGEDFMFDPEVHVKFLEMFLPETMMLSSIASDTHYNCSIHPDISKLPPAQLIVGDCDVFLKDNAMFYEKLKKSGVASKLIINKGHIHNSNLMHPLMPDGKSPSVVTGEALKHLLWVDI